MTADVSFCPYVGLQPFTEENRAYFFGREREIRLVGANLYAAKLTVLYGESGVGKSSVLMAGVVPQLRQKPRTAVVMFRDWQRPDALSILKAAVARAGDEAAGKSLGLDAGTALDELLAAAGKAIGGTTLLLLDQFEEYFLYYLPGSAGDQFDAELARAVNRRDVNAGLVLSIREDSLSKLDRFRARIPTVLANPLRIRHLRERDARDAIQKPIDVYNKRPEARVEPVSIEPALIDTLIEQTISGRVSLAQTGAAKETNAEADGRVEAPYLQLVLTRLWNEEGGQGSRVLRLATLEALKGASQIVRTHLDQVMSRLSPDDKALCANFFDRLVTPSGTKIACRLDDLNQWADAGRASDVERVVKALAAPEARILRAIQPLPGQPPQYEIFHDVLAAGVLDWRSRFVEEKKLKEAQAEAERQRKEAQRERERAAAEHRTARRLRAFSVVVAALFVIAVGAAWWAYEKQKEAQESARIARIKEFDALVERSSAEVSRIEAESQKGIAEDNAKHADEQRINAEKATAEARDREATALAAGYWHFFTSKSALDATEFNALLKLARDRTAVKRRFIEQALSDPQLAQRFAAKPSKITDVSIGINSELRKQLLSRIRGSRVTNQSGATRIPEALMLLALDDPNSFALLEALQSANQLFEPLVGAAGKVSDTQAIALANALIVEIKGTMGDSRLSVLGSGLAAAAERLTDSQAKALADALRVAIKGTTRYFQLSALVRGLMSTERPSDPEEDGIADALLVGRRLSAVEVVELDRTGKIASYTLPIKGIDYDQLSTLVHGLGAKERRYDPRAKVVADALLVAIKPTDDRYLLSALVRGLALVTGKLADTQAQALADALVIAIRDSRNPDQIFALGNALAAAGRTLSDTQAKVLTDALLVAIKGTTREDHLFALGNGLAAAVRRLSDTQAKDLADALILEIKGPQDRAQFAAAVRALAVPGMLSNDQAKALADRIVRNIEGYTNIDGLGALRRGLAEVTEALSEYEAKSLSGRLLIAIKDATNPYQLAAFGTGVAAAARRLSDTPAKGLADALLIAIKDTSNSGQLSNLGRGLAATARRLSPTQAKALTSALVSSIKVTADGVQLWALGQGLAAAAGNTKVNADLAKELIELMKYPDLPRKEIVASIRKDFKDAPLEKDGFWAFILWAQRKFPNLDLDSPAPF